MVRYRLEVGLAHGATPKHIVGAIANEAGLDSRYIGRIDLFDDHTLVDLPAGMPRELLQHLKKVRFGKFRFKLRALDEAPAAAPAPRQGHHAEGGEATARAPRPTRGRPGTEPPARSRHPAEEGTPRRARPASGARGERPPRAAPARDGSRPPSRRGPPPAGTTRGPRRS